VKSKGSIHFELLLREELVCRRLVWKCRIALLIIENIILLITCQRRLEIYDDALCTVFIKDATDRGVWPTFRT
jgi:hypothetical protein